MNWKPTLVLLALLAVVSGIYFFYTPSTPHLDNPQTKLFSFVGDRVTRIEIARKGEAPFALERVTEGTLPGWKIRPAGLSADPKAVQSMLWGLDRFIKAGALPRGVPQTAPEVTGLSDPRLTVTFHEASGGREVVRFGKAAPTNAAAVFYEREGDPMVYLLEVATFDSLDTTPARIRSRQLVQFDTFRVTGLTLERKFTVVRQGQAPGVEYEKSVFEKLDQGDEKGWFMTSPWRERLDPLKVQRLATDLVSITVEDFQPLGKPEELGLHEPEAVMTFALHGRDAPVVVRFGRLTDLRRRRWVQVEGTGEAAVIEAKKFDDLPNKRDHFRSDMIFGFTKDSVRTFDLEAARVGRVRIERRETRKPNEPVPDVKWEVLEPRGIKVDPERVESFVGNVLVQRIQEFMGPQDFKQMGLDPGDVRLSVETVHGKTHAFQFAGKGATGLLRKEGVNEIYGVSPELVEILRRLELNFLHEEIFNVPRESLREFTFESKGGGILKPVYYRMKYNEEKKAWEFTDPAHQGRAVDPDKMSSLLNALNYIQAAAFVGRGAQVALEYQLADRIAPARLEIHCTGAPVPGATFFISENKGLPTQPKYYATLQDSGIVFEISGIFVENLKLGPFKD